MQFPSEKLGSEENCSTPGLGGEFSFTAKFLVELMRGQVGSDTPSYRSESFFASFCGFVLAWDFEVL